MLLCNPSHLPMPALFFRDPLDPLVPLDSPVVLVLRYFSQDIFRLNK